MGLFSRWDFFRGGSWDYFLVGLLFSVGLFSLGLFSWRHKKDQTIARNLSYKIIFNKVVEERYMRDISSQISNDSKFMKHCFSLLGKQESPNELNKKIILIDQHPQSSWSKFPIRGMILPKSDGHIRPLLFSSESFFLPLTHPKISK